uniref:Dihydrothymine dehydrogenase n=1 Tax=candidate division WOR-3 bacterium TaxID=2052148 RepID=A0A7C4YIB6_UNCW3
MPEITSYINDIKIRNPLMTAAGPNVLNAELMIDAYKKGAGCIVTKTFSLKPAEDRRPTIKKTVSKGLLNAETWSEFTIEKNIEEILKVKRENIPIIVSIGYKPEELIKLGRIVEKEIEPLGIEFSTHYIKGGFEELLECAKSLRNSVSLPIFFKVSPSITELEFLGKEVSKYVDGFVAINSFGPALDFDPENPENILGSENGYGWLSGTPILPIALRIVDTLTNIQNKPVIGVGGISSGIDVVKFIMVGASAVQVCSEAIRKGHSIYGKMIDEIIEFMERKGFESIVELKGYFKKVLKERKIFSNKARAFVIEERCDGCKACIYHCFRNAIILNEKAFILKERCIGCGYCIDFCRKNAIVLKEE